MIPNFTPSIGQYLKKVIGKRHFSNGNVRVRFAPSPTGLLHLGGLRTALYNHLFAKSRNGVTILRIEDTDQNRKIESGTKDLVRDLGWCGIIFDEGPFYQSKRTELYQKYVKQLLEEEKAYHCFCSKVRLELLRKEALKLGEISKYDNACRSLSKDDVNKKLENGEISCIRFKLSSIKEPIQDLIYGSYMCDITANEGDPIILKSDGYPTYHFANVVDDHLMNISHVLRGTEWQISTPKHILLYRAFNWKPPIYGHLPLLLNTDGTKLSKRQGDIHIEGLRKRGYYPNAILNFVIRFGGGFNIEQKEKDVHIFTMEELFQKFDFSKIKTSSSKVTISKLDDYNKLEINRLIGTNDVQLVEQVQKIIKKYFKESEIKEKPNIEPEYVKFILKKMKGRITKVDDIVSENFIFIWHWSNKISLKNDEDIKILEKFLLEIDGLDWNLGKLKIFLREFAQKTDKKFPNLMKLIRIILTEIQKGPSVAEIMEILGRDTVHFRISNAIQKAQNRN